MTVHCTALSRNQCYRLPGGKALNNGRKRSWKFYLIYMPVPFHKWVYHNAGRTQGRTRMRPDVRACPLPALTAGVLLPAQAAQPSPAQPSPAQDLSQAWWSPVLSQVGTWSHIFFFPNTQFQSVCQLAIGWCHISADVKAASFRYGFYC